MIILDYYNIKINRIYNIICRLNRMNIIRGKNINEIDKYRLVKKSRNKNSKYRSYTSNGKNIKCKYCKLDTHLIDDCKTIQCKKCKEIGHPEWKCNKKKNRNRNRNRKNSKDNINKKTITKKNSTRIIDNTTKTEYIEEHSSSISPTSLTISSQRTIINNNRNIMFNSNFLSSSISTTSPTSSTSLNFANIFCNTSKHKNVDKEIDKQFVEIKLDKENQIKDKIENVIINEIFDNDKIDKITNKKINFDNIRNIINNKNTANWGDI